MALSHDEEGRAAAGEELAVATLAARAMAAIKEISVAWSSSRQFVPDIDPTCVVVVQVLQHILWFASTIRMISGWTVQRAHRALLCHL
jgi:hypothetical protein